MLFRSTIPLRTISWSAAGIMWRRSGASTICSEGPFAESACQIAENCCYGPLPGESSDLKAEGRFVMRRKKFTLRNMVRRQPDSPAAALDWACPLSAWNAVHTGFGTAPQRRMDMAGGIRDLRLESREGPPHSRFPAVSPQYRCAPAQIPTAGRTYQ